MTNILDKLQRKTGLVGKFTMIVYNHLTGEIVREYSEDNVVVNYAKEAVIKAIAGNTTGIIDRLQLGEDVGEDVSITGTPNLTFADGGVSGDTIFRDAGSWIEEGFISKMTLDISGTTLNDGTTYTIDTVTHDTITLELDSVNPDNVLTAEGPIGSVVVTGSASLDNPIPALETYNATTMLGYVVFNTNDDPLPAYNLSTSFNISTLTTSFVVDIIGADVLSKYPSETHKVITSAALMTSSGDAFAYKRFPQQSISELLDLTITWKISIVDETSLVCGTAPFALPIKTVYNDYIVTSDDYSILGDATTASITLDLPSAVGISGRIYNFKKVDATTNTITITPNGSETIDGVGGKVISITNDSVTMQSDGANWNIL